MHPSQSKLIPFRCFIFISILVIISFHHTFPILYVNGNSLVNECKKSSIDPTMGEAAFLDGCTYDNNLLNIVATTSLSSLSFVEIINSNFIKSSILIAGYANFSVASHSSTPFSTILIQNNTFLSQWDYSNLAILVVGAFPEKTTITISQCNFNYPDDIPLALNLAAMSLDIQLANTSTLLIINNNMTLRAIQNTLNVSNVFFYLALTSDRNCTFLASANRVEANYSQRNPIDCYVNTPATVGQFTWAYITNLVVSDSSLAIIDNIFNVTLTNSSLGFQGIFIALFFGSFKGTAFSMSNNHIQATMSSNGVTAIYFTYFGLALSVSNSSLVASKNVLEIVSTPSANTYFLYMKVIKLEASNGRIIAQRNQLKHQTLAAVCAGRARPSYLFFIDCPNSHISNETNLLVEENAIDYQDPQREGDIDLSQLYFLILGNDELTQIANSTILVRQNAIKTWHQYCFLTFLGNSQSVTVWVIWGSSIFISSNTIEKRPFVGVSAYSIATLLAATSTNMKMVFLESNVTVDNNTMAVEGKTLSRSEAYAWDTYTQFMILGSGSLVAVVGNKLNFTSEDDTESATSAIHFEHNCSISNATYSQSILAQLFSKESSQTVVLQLLSTSPTIPTHRNSSVIVASNEFSVRYTRTTVMDITKSDKLSLFSIEASSVSVEPGTMLSIQNNTVVVSGTMGVGEQHSPTLFLIFNSVITLEFSHIQVMLNSLVTPDSSYPSLVTSNQASLMSVVGTVILRSSVLAIRSNYFQSWCVAPSGTVVSSVQFWRTYASGSSLVDVSNNTFFFSVSENNVPPFQHSSVLVALITTAGNQSIANSSFRIVSNEVRVFKGFLTGVSFLQASREVAASNMFLEVCGNTANGNARKFVDNRNVLLGLRSHLTPASTFVYRPCLEMLWGMSKSTSNSLSFTQTETNSPVPSQQTFTLNPTTHTTQESPTQVCESLTPSNQVRLTQTRKIQSTNTIGNAPSLSRIPYTSLTRQRHSLEREITATTYRSRSQSLTSTDTCKESVFCKRLTIGNVNLCNSLDGTSLLFRGAPTQLLPNQNESVTLVSSSNYYSNASQGLNNSIGVLLKLDFPLKNKLVSAITPLQLTDVRVELNQTLIEVTIPVTTVAYGEDVSSLTVFGLRVVFTSDCWQRGASTNSINMTIRRVLAIEGPIRFLPKPNSVAINPITSGATTAGGILSAIGGGVAVPVAAMQQGISLALIRMAECETDALDGETLDVLVHPLQFGLGNGVSNLLILPFVWALLSYLPIPILLSKYRKESIANARNAIGWPSCLLIPYGILGEGSAMTSAALISFGGADTIFGVVGTAMLALSVCAWVFLMLRRLPIREMKLHLMRRVGFFHRAVDTRWEWVLKEQETSGDDEEKCTQLDPPLLLQNNHCFGEFWWVWANLFSYVFSLLVGIAEGMPNDTTSLCRLRWSLACIGAILQSATVLTCTIPIQLLLLGSTGAMICVLVGLVSFATFSGEPSSSSSAAVNSVATANALIGLALMCFGLMRLTFEVCSHQAARLTKRQRRSSISLLFLDSADATQSLEETNMSVPKPAVVASRFENLPPAWRSILEEEDAREQLIDAVQL